MGVPPGRMHWPTMLNGGRVRRNAKLCASQTTPCLPLPLTLPPPSPPHPQDLAREHVRGLAANTGRKRAVSHEGRREVSVVCARGARFAKKFGVAGATDARARRRGDCRRAGGCYMCYFILSVNIVTVELARVVFNRQKKHES